MTGHACRAWIAAWLIACGPGPRNEDGRGEDAGAGTDASGGGGGTCSAPQCSADFTEVLDCDGNVVQTCGPGQACGAGQCMPACDAAAANHSSVGCEYYAVAMAAMGGGFGGCFVAFVANTWAEPVHLTASWGASAIDLGAHARIPRGSGPGIVYEPYDPVGGLPPGEVAILFLANDPVPHGTWRAPAACPVPAAVGLDAHVHWGYNIDTGRTKAFRIASDRPVVAYQMLPYNAASSATTGASLLLPTSAWHTEYLGVTASRAADFMGSPVPPTMAIVAKEPGTEVTIKPAAPIRQGIGVAGGQAGVPITYTLGAGEAIEFIQIDDLSGSPIEASKPIAVFAGHTGLRVPFDVGWSDHAEQQLPPLRALGHEYATGLYRDRVAGYAEHRRHRIVGAVDGTTLVFDPPIAGAPSTVGTGTIAEFTSDTPFVVRSQDDDHPFMLFTYMTGSDHLAAQGAPAGYGDAEFVRVVPGEQYLRRYVFFADPTYPETNLVVVRRAGASGFADVTLDCAGVLTGWQPIGTGATYQWTRADLSRNNFAAQGACHTGRREMHSTQPFGLTVWGWGSPETRPGKHPPCDLGSPDNSCDVSYAYPAGESVRPINDVVILL